MLKVKSSIRLVVLSNPFLYVLKTFMQGKVQGIGYNLVNKRTDICVEGFARSGNTFALHLLKVVETNLNIAHHSHSIANIKLAFRRGVPVICLIRNPIDAITSWVIRENGESGWDYQKAAYYAIAQYRQFVIFILNNQNKMQIIDFNILVNNTKEFLAIVAKTIPNLVSAVEDIRINMMLDKTMSSIKEEAQAQRKGVNAVSIPNAERDKIKFEVKKYINDKYKKDITELNNLYNSALRLYEFKC